MAIPTLSRKFRAALTGLAACAVALGLSACGSSSSQDPGKLLDQTFSGSHSINSGNLSFSVTLSPSGSSTIKSPITLSFGGPFQSLGQGKLPASNFSISVSALGRNGSLSILSTGKAGYVTVSGTSYQLPAATFQKLESSFAQVSGSGGGGSGAGTLSKLGIQPLHWLQHPSVVGKESVAGVDTTHIRAGINVNALLGDLNTLLQKASSLGVSGASSLSNGIPSTTRSQIAQSVQNPTVDVWTGNNDKTLRRMTLNLTVPVTGQVSTALGGLRTAQIGLDMKYAGLNQPQTISAPTTVRPYSEFQTKLQSLVASLQGTAASATGAGAGATSGATGSPGTTPTPSPSSATSTIQRYNACLSAAGNDVSKMQRCASILNGK